MKNENIDAVALKRALQKKTERKLARLSEQEQLELLQRKFGHLSTSRRGTRVRRELQAA
ncbi:MAG: hypothetical protein KGJ80_06145 [Chloroflexota bacterium]|nr:hypothetical protein [Chloroflexota bacterium]